MPSTQIAKCISTFLSCLDIENRDAVQNIKESDVEGSGFTEVGVANTPTTMNSTAMNCYQSFQDCSGSVILIPDLYNGTAPVNQGIYDINENSKSGIYKYVRYLCIIFILLKF